MNEAPLWSFGLSSSSTLRRSLLSPPSPSNSRQARNTMRVHKRASKRVSTKQREKVKKKVREHKRKSKREAKSDPTWRTKKRQDPGIPNSFPYKEQLLNEIEQRRTAVEQQRLAEREARVNGSTREGEREDDEQEMTNAEDGSEEELAEDDLDDDAPAAELFVGSLKTFVDEYTGKSAAVKLSQVIVALDARDPLSWRVAEVDELFKHRKCEVLYALTRADLVPREQVAAWIAHLSHKSAPSFAICTLNGHRGGVDRLAGKVKGKAVAVLGVQNSGRTSLADALAVALPDTTVFDTPALVPSSSKQAHVQDAEDDEVEDDDSAETLERRDRQAAHRILIRNAGGIFKVHEPMPLIDALMRRIAHPADLMMAFTAPAYVDTNDFLVSVARSSGRLRKGAVPDTLAAARTVLHQWSSGTMGYYAKAPALGESDKEKERVRLARETMEQDDSLTDVLPRKQWRERWQGKELRLTTSNENGEGMLDGVKIAFANVQVDNDDDDDDVDDEEEDEGDVVFDDEEEEDEDEEDEEDDMDDEEEEEDDEE